MVMGSVWEEVGWWVILLRGREESGVGHNGTGQVSTVAHHLLLASCNLQEICVVSHIKIQLYMFHVIWIVVTVVTYIRISTPQGAPIWTTFIGQIVVGCIQFTMPHRSGLESYVNTNKNHFVFHSIQSETWCIQTWFQGGVYFIRNQFCASLSPCLRRIYVTENLTEFEMTGSQNISCFFGRFSLFLTVWLMLIMTRISDDKPN